MSDATSRPSVSLYVGLFLTTLATLAYQLLLTRIFSLTLWYHYTFMAISVSMFGMTVGAVLVYLFPRLFPAEAAVLRMGQAISAFALLIVVTYLIHLRLHLDFRIDAESPWGQLAAVAGDYALLSLPFVASGICVTIALTRFPEHVGKLYAVDLAGAAAGCLIYAVVARYIDAPTLILDTATLVAVGGVVCLGQTYARASYVWATTVLMALVSVVFLSISSSGQHADVFRPRWVKGQKERRAEVVRWNAYSRVAVWYTTVDPMGWGLSSRYVPRYKLDQKWMNIDAAAGTAITRFVDNLEELEHLRYDVTNVAHSVRPDSRVLVLGSGGGRDILSALVFKQPEVVGVEINDTILDLLENHYGNFSGHLASRDDVTLVNDEARCFLARTDRKFDIIQVSLIDTWAATAAGAYTLTENALYTEEAWQRMLHRLTDRGVISFSRWYAPERPGEIYRLAVLAAEALRQDGATNVADHLMVVWCPPSAERIKAEEESPEPDVPMGMATLLAARQPFTDTDVATLRQVAQEMAFEVLLAPDGASDEMLRRLASDEDLDVVLRDTPLDLSPPTDDRPFFFDMLRLRNVLFFSQLNDEALDPNIRALHTLGMLLITVVVLTVLCVIVPLLFTLRRQPLARSVPLWGYFSCIGLGFMLVEMAMIQRLNLFLGHPIYSMTVVLFSLLAATGAGSWLSGRLVGDAVRDRRAPGWLAILVAMALLVGWLASPPVLSQFDGLAVAVRITIACALLVPLGLALGAGFPLGMRVSDRLAPGLSPWLFGLNGAMSICGSVVAVVISLCLGITATLMVGVSCYALALALFCWSRRNARLAQAA